MQIYYVREVRDSGSENNLPFSFVCAKLFDANEIHYPPQLRRGATP